MIRELAQLTLENGLFIVYGGIASAIAAGVVFAVAVVLITAAAAAGER